MGMFNTLKADMVCPHCGQTGEMEIDMYFGDTRNLSQFRMGDLYLWLPDRPAESGGRPPDGSVDGEGYTECPNCGRDFYADVLIRVDRITEVQANLHKPGYITQPVSKAQAQEQAGTTSFSWKNWKPPILEPGRKGKITPGRYWVLTPKIEALLDQLTESGVDIFSNTGGSDYVLLVPNGVDREEFQAIEQMMHDLGKILHAKLEYRDWYPHGSKYCISPKKGTTHEPT